MTPSVLSAIAVILLLFFQILIWRRLRESANAKPDFSPLQARLDLLEKQLEQSDRGLRDEFLRLRQEIHQQLEQRFELLRNSLMQAAQQSREETSAALKSASDGLRTTVETRLAALSADNERRLDQMRQTVDEKLQGTLEMRLGESFKLVSERLEQVHRGLGEMQSLASGVGDLKRVLTNVKTRGTWGEVQLGSLLEQILAPDQFERNVSTTGTLERVEFAIKLPGAAIGDTCWLPVDAKFPVEDYQRLMEAAEKGDPDAVETAGRTLENTIKICARTISEKYLNPPGTTDFGILFLATEGLYAEAIRRTGLSELLQREYRVILTGPTTFAAILNSLQVGFRTLAIQQRSGEVWQTLGAVKTEFAKYAAVLSKVKKKLQEASNTVDRAESRTRVLQNHLRAVEGSPSSIPELPSAAPEEEEVPIPELPGF
ncbi:MAG TPA: DNA recombination protein RmuC [Bryobacteraceae bacterium]|jgi:DNA recombination protein RmuC|nr:DNA recombination protein RmuC [Bryobacteraceae bacterium]